MAAASSTTEPLLLHLPEPCLLAVLEGLQDDAESLYSAARAHSRLHQHVLELNSITACLWQQKQADGLMTYLQQYKQHITSLHLAGEADKPVCLSGMPPGLQLRSLTLRALQLPMQPGAGVLGALVGSPLKQLRLHRCVLLGVQTALAASLELLPALEHLSLVGEPSCWWHYADVLQQLPHLTFLEMAGITLHGAGITLHATDDPSKILHRLTALERLVDLRLHLANRWLQVSAAALARSPLLTRLDLSGALTVQPSILRGMTQLQHLKLPCPRHSPPDAPNASEEAAELLSHLGQLQQVTYLRLASQLVSESDVYPPPAAYSALTASTRLQHLDIASCTLPPGVWQHVFPTGRLLPHLTEFCICAVQTPSGDFAAAPDGTRLVSCCPALQFLDMRDVTYSTAEVLAPLQQLSGLRTLELCASGHDFPEKGVEALLQLPQLRELDLEAPPYPPTEWLQLQLTKLTRLTALTAKLGGQPLLKLTDQGPDGQPVWCQLNTRWLDHSRRG